MPELSDFVQTAISATSATPSVPGFGIPMVLSQGAPVGFTNRYRVYSSDAAAVADGYAASHPTVIALQKAFAQSPRPPLVGVGRRALPTTQSVKLTCGSAVQGDVYSLDVIIAGVTTTVTRTVPGSSTTTAEATAIAALINAISGATSTSSGAVITTTATSGAGVLIRYTNWTVNGARSANFTLFDSSADPGIATDLAAIRAENDTWYGLTVDSCSKAEILAAAAWAEANKKLLAQQSSDSACIDSGSSTDVMAAAQTAGYDYTAILYNGNDTQAFAGLAWQAYRFAATPIPGSDTWCYNTLKSLSSDVLSETEFATVGAKNGTAYVSVGGVNYTAASGIATDKSGGKSSSGIFIDTRRFRDWQVSDINLSVFLAIAPGTGKRVPFTGKGMAIVESAVLGSLRRGEAAGGNVEGASAVAVPDIASISTADKLNRILSGLTFETEDTGGIHLVSITGDVQS